MSTYVLAVLLLSKSHRGVRWAKILMTEGGGNSHRSTSGLIGSILDALIGSILDAL